MKTTGSILALALALGLAGAAHATVPVVTNVVASQSVTGKLVHIYYDVFDAEGDFLKISVEVSHTGGATYNIPATNFVGDYGDNIATGVNKHIVWDAGKDWDGEYSTQMVVKVTASDAKGLPGLQWGNEVPAGGFLMGQEGGAEGYGPSKHVNIPWSYWLSKYEITAGQYAEYLNLALAAGKVRRIGTTSVSGLTGISSNQTLITLSSSRDVVWNVNAFEVPAGRTNFPVRVPWYGAISFAQFYGYDLPTDAEWEKAVRGPDHGGVDQHLAYPWGNSLAIGYANFESSGDPYESSQYGETTPVGYFSGNQVPLGPDMANGYGLYDVCGNVAEWTISASISSVESYPSVESLTNSVNSFTNTTLVVRGGKYVDYSSDANLKCYSRESQGRTADAYYGFRVIRRNP